MSFTNPCGECGCGDPVAVHADGRIAKRGTPHSTGRDPLEDIARSLLVEIGEDPDREGLQDTPARYARWWREFTEYDPGTLDTCFTEMTAGQLIQVNNMRVWSLCEHHLLPFWCDVSIAYISYGKILGLSKFARIAHGHAHRLQVQERLTADIADTVEAISGSPDVAVRICGEHLCMIMRGIRTVANMSTSVLRGVFRDDPDMRGQLSS
jgi:GTP cyclohydrolase I